MPVRAPDRGRITEDELAQQILKIMGTKADPRTPPVGILTTMKRPAWGKAREELLKRAYNYNFLAKLINTILWNLFQSLLIEEKKEISNISIYSMSVKMCVTNIFI